MNMNKTPAKLVNLRARIDSARAKNQARAGDRTVNAEPKESFTSSGKGLGVNVTPNSLLTLAMGAAGAAVGVYAGVITGGLAMLGAMAAIPGAVIIGGLAALKMPGATDKSMTMGMAAGLLAGGTLAVLAATTASPVVAGALAVTGAVSAVVGTGAVLNASSPSGPQA